MAQMLSWKKALAYVIAEDCIIKCLPTGKEICRNEFFDYYYREENGKWIQINLDDKVITWLEFNSAWKVVEKEQEE